MIEVHDPVRLMIIVEQFPNVVLQTIKQSNQTYEWFINEWVHLVAVHPETKELFHFKNGNFEPYRPVTSHLQTVSDISPLLESQAENFPVYLLS
jgi:uncharacterized protein YbcC (UPF0753/DUF2309 family)